MPYTNWNNIKLVIADDHEIVRLGLRDMLESDKFISLLEEADNGEDAVELAEYFNPDMVLLDRDMPRMNGAEAGKLIKNNNPQIKVVIYITGDDLDSSEQNFDFDSDGLLSKQLPGNELISALHRIANGEKLNLPECQCYKTANVIGA